MYNNVWEEHATHAGSSPHTIQPPRRQLDPPSQFLILHTSTLKMEAHSSEMVSAYVLIIYRHTFYLFCPSTVLNSGLLIVKTYYQIILQFWASSNSSAPPISKIREAVMLILVLFLPSVGYLTKLLQYHDYTAPDDNDELYVKVRKLT
jgi:hypothetical protein